MLYPQRQHLQALLQYVDPKAPYVYNEWLSVLAETRYRMPEDLRNHGAGRLAVLQEF